MIVILHLGGAAVLAFVALNRLRDHDPEATAEAVRNVRQLVAVVAVVVVLACATSAVLDELQSAASPSAACGLFDTPMTCGRRPTDEVRHAAPKASSSRSKRAVTGGHPPGDTDQVLCAPVSAGDCSGG